MAVILQLSENNNNAFGKSQVPIGQFITAFDAKMDGDKTIKKIFQMDTASTFAVGFSYECEIDDFEPVGENGKYPETDFVEGYDATLSFESWKNDFSISQEALEDGIIGTIAKDKSRKMLSSYYRTRERFAAQLVANLTAASFKFGKKAKTFKIAAADGQPFFSKVHPSKVKKSLVQTNLFNLDSTAGKIYDKIIAIETLMQNFKDDNGNIIGIMPDTILIPNNSKIKKLVFEALNADGQPGTPNNDGNFIAGRFNVIVWNYAERPLGATTDDWFIMMDSDWNQDFGGLVWRDRIPLTIKSIINDTDDSNTWNARARFNATSVNWRAMAIACDNTNATTIVV